MATKAILKARKSGLDDLAGLLHDLKSPLMLIEANLDRLAKRWHISDSDVDLGCIRNLISAVESNTQAALLLNQLARGKYNPNLKNVDLNRYVEKIALSFKPFAKKCGIKLHLNLDPTLKVGSIDPFAIQRIVTNLLSNAVKFSPPGSLVTLSTIRKGARFSIVVSDQGVGIKPSQRPKLFKPWSRGAESIGDSSHGLGLFVVKSLADCLGGQVSVKSRPGQGAHFCVSLGGL